MAFLNNYPPSLITGLTLDFTRQPYTRQTFTTMESLITAARTIQTQLTKSSTANQYLLVQNLPIDILNSLIEDKNALDGITFRFTFEGNTGLIKIIPAEHTAVTRELAKTILLECLLAGVPSKEEIYWTGGGTAPTMYKVAAGGANSEDKGKQPDDSFLPLTRQPHGWPTLVIESGIPESLPRLREDAKWWFETSAGAVRSVLVLGINTDTKTIEVEKWAFGHTHACPIRVPYLVQSVTVSPRGIEGGAAVTIRFRELFGRPPKWDDEERDILLGGKGLVDVVRFLD
ncbi:hypothetical protein SI65_00858 [Aspergillus cristatus]|uniref:Uncharacterized protein n=1 Tax=Aspergillus cristatus TaxID=573508 RepID=A0A1E3BQP3_ASPCR|nr:hypothetical protein SI65_00858 [Aspergillus cristatus]